MIRFIGDIHGQWTAYRRMIANINYPTVQVGDFGLGFPGWQKTDPQKFPENNYFLRGNHDNPEIARHHPNYLGEFGYNEKLDVFFISGAYSIDYAWRTEGLTWWRDEELSYEQFQQCIDLYTKIKPKIVVSHDCPKWMQKQLISHHDETSRTNSALQEMFEIHQPEMWIFGHHHKNFQVRSNGTLFVCIRDGGVADLGEENENEIDRK